MEVKIDFIENREIITPNMLEYVLDLLFQYETQKKMILEEISKEEGDGYERYS